MLSGSAIPQESPKAGSLEWVPQPSVKPRPDLAPGLGQGAGKLRGSRRQHWVEGLELLGQRQGLCSSMKASAWPLQKPSPPG